MSIISRLKTILISKPSDLQKLEFQLQKLSNRKRMLEHQGRVDRTLELNIEQVHQQIVAIHEKRDRIHQQDAKLLDEAYAELDAEFPGLQDLLNSDRSS